MNNIVSRKKFIKLGASTLALGISFGRATAQNKEPMSTASLTSSCEDFNFLIGSWTIKNRKLKKRLSGSHDWEEFDATGEMVRILNGMANTDNFIANLEGKPFEGRALRLFDQKTKLWSIYWTDSNGAVMDAPLVGSFDGAVGKFYADDTFNKKPIKVMFQWDKTNPENPVWSQAFSSDAGKTWEWNWYMDFRKTENPNSNHILKVIELRNYLLKPDSFDAFHHYFRDHFIESQNILNGYALGQFQIDQVKDHFFWIRGFTDMASRLNFLKAFYNQSAAWKTFGPGANDFILSSDNAHLLRPVNVAGDWHLPSDGIIRNDFLTNAKVVVVEYYSAKQDNPGDLIEKLRAANTDLKPGSHTTLWISEMAKSEFRHPVIQESNLLVSITGFLTDGDYQQHVNSNAPVSGLSDLVKARTTITLHAVAS